MTNKNNDVIYAVITNNLVKRIYQHKNKLKLAQEKIGHIKKIQILLS